MDKQTKLTPPQTVDRLLQTIANRLPTELVPEPITPSTILTAIQRLKTERNNAVVDKEQRCAFYALGLHDSLPVAPGLEVTRVPGGWIYKTYNHSTFVPFDNEFQ